MDLIRQLQEQMRVYGIDVQMVALDETGFGRFNAGIRDYLFHDFDYKKELHHIVTQLKERSVYAIKDEFELWNYFFLLPGGSGEKKKMVHIGPFLSEPPSQILSACTEKNGLDVYQENELEIYYYNVPVILEPKFVEGLIVLQAAYIYGPDARIKIEHIVDFYGKSRARTGGRYREPDNKLSAEILEARYRQEEELLEAVTKGDRAAAYAAYTRLAVHQPKQRMESSLENKKYALLSENTLYRKAVQAAGVHPVHIDEVSGGFVKQIEKSVFDRELRQISHEMIRRYCLLVKKYSLQGYSPVVRNAVNYIDLHLGDALSLQIVAGAGNVSVSYLSARFKKEVGQTVIEYINEHRVLEARRYLAVTDLSIGEVAERVGISDGNYFTKLFRKYHKCTPKEYRNIIRSEQ